MLLYRVLREPLGVAWEIRHARPHNLLVFIITSARRQMVVLLVLRVDHALEKA